jgi:hypothetical protein
MVSGAAKRKKKAAAASTEALACEDVKPGTYRKIDSLG